ncbi:E3 ubiquitin-protein ligase KCMF1-like [Aegotheles albertisi]
MAAAPSLRAGPVESVAESGHGGRRKVAIRPCFAVLREGRWWPCQCPLRIDAVPGTSRDDDSDREVTVKSMSPKEIRSVRQDYTRNEGESLIAWMLRCWDTGADFIDLESRKARQLGGIARDADIDRMIGSKIGTHSLWARLLSAVKSRYPFREDIECRPIKWNTIERGVGCLREMAVHEIIYEDEETPRNPDELQCSRAMLRKLTRSAPPVYSHILGGRIWGGDGEEPPTVSEFVYQLRQYEDSVSSPLQARVAALEKTAEEYKTSNEELRNRLSRVERENDTHSSPECIHVSAIRNRRSPARSAQHRRNSSRGSLWFILRDHGEDMSRWDGKPTAALCARVQQIQGVSCDACLKGNFRGRRYKCLICYDYDLCATCYESGATTTRHTTDHPMQCILTRVDFDLYYGGEAFSVEQPQSFTCPYCGKMGYTETSLQEHVASEHAETSTEVICPICAALPGGDPNHVTDDFAAHLTLEHRALLDYDESSGVRHVRRMFHPGRGLGGPRARRSNMHFTSSSTGGLSSSQSSYSPSNRETMDPIAELLSQLSGVRRSAGQLNSSGPSASQLQQLQMQLQLERQHAQAARQQLETARNATRRTNTSSIPTTLTQSIAATNTSNTENNQQTTQNSQFLLTRLNDPKMSEAERQSKESERADRSLFVQELLLSTLMREESSSSDEDERGEIADFGAMGCVDIMPLDVALENLNLRESNKGNEPPL